MAIKEIPTGALPYEEVAELPASGVENTIYGVPRDEDAFFVDTYRWHDGEWQQVELGDQIFGFLFADYQESVTETVAEMQATIDEQQAKIAELEEAVFPIENTSFEMLITSLTYAELDLYDANDEIVPNMGLAVEVWEEPQELVYQNEVRKGTYYLKNSDGYALGTPGGEIQPLVCEGGTVNLGNVEVIMIQPSEGSEVR